MTAKWSKDTPGADGWYWIQYENKRGGKVVCPCEVTHLMGGVHVLTARCDTFLGGPNHGGPELKCAGQVDKSIRFGPAIPYPE